MNEMGTFCLQNLSAATEMHLNVYDLLELLTCHEKNCVHTPLHGKYGLHSWKQIFGMGNAIAQVVRCLFLSPVAWLKPRSVHVGFMVDKVALG
jgi:hypothetical protein